MSELLIYNEGVPSFYMFGRASRIGVSVWTEPKAIRFQFNDCQLSTEARSYQT